MKDHLRQAGMVLTALVFTSLTIKTVMAEETVDAEREAEQRRQENHSVFFSGKNQSIDEIKIRLNDMLAQRIAAVDRTCHLDDAQKKKLELAGRGAIKHLFESIEEQKKTLTWKEIKKGDGVVRFLEPGPAVGTLRSKLRGYPRSDHDVRPETSYR